MKNRMLKITKYSIVFLITLSFIWAISTIIVEEKGPARSVTIGEFRNNQKKALVVYDPDPFYNFDEQICYGYSKGLAENGWLVKMATVAAVQEFERSSFDLYTFCANTYNWAPDAIIRTHINTHKKLKDQPVVAITLGGGSTNSAKHRFEKLLHQKGADLIASEEYWLWRPNDESRMEESNVIVGIDLAQNLGRFVATKFAHEE